MKVINIGYGNFVMANRIVAIVSPDSAPAKRIIQESKEKSLCIDATYGKKTKTVIIIDSDHVVLSSLPTDKIASRVSSDENTTNEGSDE